MGRNHDVINFISKFQPLILRPVVDLFADVIKIVIMFIKRIFKDSKKSLKK